MYYTHINRNIIASNKKHGTSEPAIRVQEGRYGDPEYAFRVKFKDGEVLYKPDGDPILPCGARLVIKSEEKPEIMKEST